MTESRRYRDLYMTDFPDPPSTFAPALLCLACVSWRLSTGRPFGTMHPPIPARKSSSRTRATAATCPVPWVSFRWARVVFQSFNLNKRSVTVDLKSEAGAVFMDLVRSADAAVNNPRRARVTRHRRGPP